MKNRKVQILKEVRSINKKEKGFTLIELLAVILLMALRKMVYVQEMVMLELP